MKHQIPTPESWRDALESYLSWMRAAGAPDTTAYLRSYHLRRFASETKRPPFPMTLDFLAGYLGGHAKLSPSSRSSIRSSLRAFYQWAHITGRMEHNPAASLPKIRVQAGKPRPAPEAAVEAGKRTHDIRTRLMVQMAAYAGMRCGEIAKASSTDIFEDFVGWSIVVHGKGGKDRVVELRDELAHMLRQLPAGYFFPGQIDGHLSAGYVSKLVSGALPAGVTGHMLRHWFAGKAYRASGNDIRAVQELLGHASVATTQIYTAIEDGAKRRAVNF
ncbi:tyrosine-type recombinase/integrase [Plantibacter sp. YIM 135249]|uniref:tyrosine-type recombinase/integrase n=1 Tax=Plantibacter sp. YIM 135249 TaxID=3423918 RepID=UPI003D338295